MMKLITVIVMSIFLCVSCAVVPVEKSRSPRDIECGVTSHEYDLKMVQMGSVSASCDTPECILSIGLFAAAWTGFTAIVSGSIVVVGNTVHWLEQQGPCDTDTLDQQVAEVNAPLIKQGGKPILIKEALEQELEEE